MCNSTLQEVVIYDFGIHVSLHAPKLGALKLKNLRNSNFAELFGPNRRCGRMVSEGAISEEEHLDFVVRKQKLLFENEVEIEAHTKASQETLLAGVKVIELLQKAHEFMKLDGNLLEKARLAKLVLSNPILKDGTVEFSYRKEFDLLIELTRGRNWWS